MSRLCDSYATWLDVIVTGMEPSKWPHRINAGWGQRSPPQWVFDTESYKTLVRAGVQIEGRP